MNLSPLRVKNSFTGKTATPPLFESMEVLGKEKTVNRLQAVIRSLSN